MPWALLFHSGSRPRRGRSGHGGNPEIPTANPTKARRPTGRQAGRRHRDEQDEGGELGAVFGEVETIDELAPTMLGLLRATARHASLFAPEANAALRL
jgi:hypothetical protein